MGKSKIFLLISFVFIAIYPCSLFAAEKNIKKCPEGEYMSILLNRIQKYWNEDPASKKDGLIATVIINFYMDGAIKDFHFDQESIDPEFNKAVSRAIIKAYPYPVFDKSRPNKVIGIGMRFQPRK